MSTDIEFKLIFENNLEIHFYSQTCQPFEIIIKYVSKLNVIVLSL